jgi:hypothetical protein
MRRTPLRNALRMSLLAAFWLAGHSPGGRAQAPAAPGGCSAHAAALFPPILDLRPDPPPAPAPGGGADLFAEQGGDGGE